jgi:hypothetical protein
LPLEFSREIRGVSIAALGSNFLDPEAWVRKKNLGSGESHCPQRCSKTGTCFSFDEVLEARRAEAKFVGDTLHRQTKGNVFFHEFSCTLDPIIHGTTLTLWVASRGTAASGDRRTHTRTIVWPRDYCVHLLRKQPVSSKLPGPGWLRAGVFAFRASAPVVRNSS